MTERDYNGSDSGPDTSGRGRLTRVLGSVFPVPGDTVQEASKKVTVTIGTLALFISSAFYAGQKSNDPALALSKNLGKLSKAVAEQTALLRELQQEHRRDIARLDRDKQNKK